MMIVKKGEGAYVVRQVIEEYECAVSSKKDCLVFYGPPRWSAGEDGQSYPHHQNESRLKHIV